MPYIKDTEIKRAIRAGAPPENAGELNYAFTMIAKKYLKEKGLSYQTCNDIVGALDNAKGEFKRRIQDPYEDVKIKENGDVYK
jgi:hypothetical protein